MTIKHTDTLGSALRIMGTNNVLSLPIINADGEIDGFVDMLDVVCVSSLRFVPERAHMRAVLCCALGRLPMSPRLGRSSTKSQVGTTPQVESRYSPFTSSLAPQRKTFSQ